MMSPEEDFVQSALGFLAKIGADLSSVTPSTHLINDGVLDSLGMLAFLDFLEERWGVEIEIDGTTLEKISTLESAHRFMTTSDPGLMTSE